MAILSKLNLNHLAGIFCELIFNANEKVVARANRNGKFCDGKCHGGWVCSIGVWSGIDVTRILLLLKTSVIQAQWLQKHKMSPLHRGLLWSARL